MKETIGAYLLSTKAMHSSSKIGPLLIDDVSSPFSAASKKTVKGVWHLCYIKVENNKKAAVGPLGPYWDL